MTPEEFFARLLALLGAEDPPPPPYSPALAVVLHAYFSTSRTQ